MMLVDGTLHHVPAIPVIAVDTLGGGDVFHGAYTLALAEGKDGARCGALRERGGGDQVFAAAAGSGSPARPEVDALVERVSRVTSITTRQRRTAV
jgi:sulfofructose kinase